MGNGRQQMELLAKRITFLPKSQKVFIVGGLLAASGLTLAWHTFRAMESPPDTTRVIEGMTSPIYMSLLRHTSPVVYGIALPIFLLGLFFILIGYLNWRDEEEGKAKTPFDVTE